MSLHLQMNSSPRQLSVHWYTTLVNNLKMFNINWYKPELKFDFTSNTSCR